MNKKICTVCGEKVDDEYFDIEQEKCILHCEKQENDWYTINPIGEKVWDKVKTENFWILLNQKKTNSGNTDFSNLIFPEFTENCFEYFFPKYNINDGIVGAKPKYQVTKDVKFNNVVFMGKTFFDGIEFTKNLKFQFTKFEDSVTFYDCKIGKHFIFEVSKHKKYFDIWKCEVNELSFIAPFFEKDTIVQLRDLHIKKLTLSKIKNSSDFFRLDKITIEDNLNLEKMNFKNFNFNDIEFNGKIKIDGCSFFGATFTNINWGDISRIEANRETFVQLKKIYDNQGNHITANSFHSVSMSKWIEELKQKENACFQDKVIAWFGEISSNFSQSWLLPLLWIITFTLGFFLDYYILQSLENTDIPAPSIVRFIIYLFLFLLFIYFNETSFSIKPLTHWETVNIIMIIVFGIIFYICNFAFSDLLKFLNPLKKINNNGDYFIGHIIYRLFLGLFLYQLTIAFRRQTRR